ncbi:MAG: DUF1232 domain-containing protein [Gemmatimonadetes bacterium]|uniref:DUF1232 domain-containing protein n=1 Tax=Candidatus Kutchimonas denitrificans TaxID=3056748 RepID=A0AAE4Z802_9BACT|nr:DUF1232 domain-containing protein [Gemmatimonadota bacterium]NIR74668.1 DUF1232 domain-containing protein [Candidatus Kutchimonas denitrificans]NIS01418.1 DUF1232 domain-containing protein [Gemmatimonadota bacterium]NIT67159.1 DUF1232 domain-containing protein [Gemmatimonadota bacterium]NIU52333.1 DUF1232 domain-containing protein [Gemmatimonadota bacterium]
MIVKHERTPPTARWLLGAAIAYAVSPIDLIPDGIPLIGHLDDLVVVPGLIWLALRVVPADVVRECRAAIETSEAPEADGNSGKPR